MFNDYYDKNGCPITPMYAKKLQEDKTYWLIDKSLLSNDAIVCTVWVGLDLAQNTSSKAPPQIFETTVTTVDGWIEERRTYATLEAAKAGHHQIATVHQLLLA